MEQEKENKNRQEKIEAKERELLKQLNCQNDVDNKKNEFSHPKKSASETFNSSQSLLSSTSRRRNRSSKLQNNPSLSYSNVHISMSTQDKCKLSEWGLPAKIYEKYEHKGVTRMFAWQVECLANHNILEGKKNLVYSAPTSAGKTLVSEILMMKSVLEQKKKAIFILPFVSVVREKMFYFQELLSDSGIRVEGFMGNVTPAGGFASVNIAIATIEKANSLINRLMEEKELGCIGIIVIDELHLLGDPSRGYLLELLLTKLKYAAMKTANVNVQLVGMSATLPNLSSLAKWLDAELYKTDFRPIPLAERCKIGNTIYDDKLNPVRTLSPIPDLAEDTDDIFQLCLETIQDGHGTLIFCPTKNWCEKLALQIAGIFAKLGHSDSSYGAILREKLDTELIKETLEQLKRCPIGLDAVLKNTVSFGVAFHHAGLTMDERDIIEGAFRVGSLKVLTATSTLSSGVNLPARRVIVRSPIFNRQVLNTLVYRQMIGRAGRMGKDTSGESILLCKPNEEAAAKTLLSAPLDEIESCLEGSGRLLRTLLEAIASQMVRTTEDLNLYLQCTFAVACDEDNLKDCVLEATQFLSMNEFITMSKSAENEDAPTYLEATPLGKACLAAAISPRDGLYLFEELQKARRCIALDSELHILYLVTPYDSGNQINQIDWINYMEIFKSLGDSERRIGSLIGVEERLLISAMRGKIPVGKQLSIYRRFYTALALFDLINEMSLNEVCKKYNCCRGMLQSLQQSSATLAGMVTQFCKELGWSCMELLVSQFQARLYFGVGRDLLDLLRLSSLNGIRARSLYKEGIKTVADLAVANERDVERALNKAIPFESAKNNVEDEQFNFDTAEKRKMKTIFITGRDGLTAQQAAVILIQEARDLIKNELGVKQVDWNNKEDSDSSDQLCDSSIININNTENQSTIVSPGQKNDSSYLMNSIIARNHSIISSNRNAFQNNTTHRLSFGSFQDSSLFANPILDVPNQHPNSISVKIDARQITETHSIVDTPSRAEGNPQETTNQNRVQNSTRPETDLPEPELVLDSLPSEFMNTFNEPSRLSIKNNITNNADTIDQFMEEMPSTINTPNQEQSQKNLSRNQQSTDMMSFGSPWFDNNIIYVGTVKKDEVSQTKENAHAENNEDQSVLNKTETSPRVSQSKKSSGSSDDFLCPKNVSSNRSRGSNTFTDSLMDAAMCEILEQNIFDSDLEKDELPLNAKQRARRRSHERSRNISSGNLSTKAKTDTVQAVSSMSWIDVPWSQMESSKQPKIAENKSNLDKANISVKPKSKPVIIVVDECNSPQKPTVQSESNFKLKFQTNENKMNSKTQLETEPFSNDNNVTKRNVTKRKLSGNTNTVEELDLNMTSWSDSWESNAKKPRVSIRDQENMYKSSSESPKSVKSSTKNKSRTSSEFDSSARHSSESPQKITKTPRTKRKQPMQILNDENKNSSLKTGNTFGAKTLSERNIIMNINVNAVDAKKKLEEEKLGSCLQKNVLDLKDDFNQKLECSYDPMEGSSTMVSRRKSIYSKTDEEQTEEDFHFASINVIRLEGSKSAFKLFKTEIENQPEISMALACESVQLVASIGNKILGQQSNRSRRSGSYICDDKQLCGIAITWGLGAIYYISLTKSPEDKVTVKDRMSIVTKILNSSNIKVRCFSTKDIYKAIYKYIEVAPLCHFLDPKVITWLLNPDGVEKSFRTIAMEYFPKGKNILQQCDTSYSTGSPGLNVNSPFTAFNRSVGEALLTWYMIESLYKKTQNKNPVLLKTFEEIEMKTVTILARMELRGFGIDTIVMREIAILLENEMKFLEEQAYTLAGRSFKFCSPKEVSQVLNLPKKGKISTGKSVLEKCDNPIANLIILWRKLNTTGSKVIIPILNMIDSDSRIRGNCITHTVTGRISMHEPNIQSIPNDFTSHDGNQVFSLRSAFIPNPNNVLLAADYCQLELRIMAHFSKDPVLCDAICNHDEDIFKSISAVWNRVPIESVDTVMRNRTKQLCYGMIYGMGTKTLAETLKVTEAESTEFLENFMSTFKGVRKWLGSVIEKARMKGYITTIMGRRRHLPGLYSEKQSEKSQSERQAVNTKVQGTAADIAKKAMVLIEQRMQKSFPHADIVFSGLNDTKQLRSSATQCRGGYLVLQLHDELLYEVKADDLKVAACIIKESMENAIKLDVPLPVKIKIGPTWGDLIEYND